MAHLTRRKILKTGAAGVVAGLVASGCSQTTAGPQRSASGAVPLPIGSGEPLNVGFIGVGGRGTALLTAFLKLEGQRVVAICDIDKKNLDHGIGLVEKAQGKAPQAYSNGPDDFKNVLNRKDIHAVVTAAPCDEHARMMLEAIHAGKHIYGEKPLALNVAAADAVVSATHANPKLVVQVGFQWMANQRFIDSIGRIHDGQIGDLIEGRICRHNRAHPLRRWFSLREKSGDWMLEQACHEYNVMNWVAGTTPLRAYGMGRRDLFQEGDPQRNVTDYYTAIIEYPKGFIVHYAHGWISPEGFTGMDQKVIGSKGAIEVGGSKMALRDEKKPAEPIKAQGGDDTQAALAAFLTSIREGKPPVAPVTNGRNASLLALMVRKAVDKRTVVTWEEMLRSC